MAKKISRPLGDIDINPESLASASTARRAPFVTLADVSGSMRGDPITFLNAGLTQMVRDLLANPKGRRGDFALVTFGDAVEVPQEFVQAEHITLPSLQAHGRRTPIGEALSRGLRLLEDREAFYRGNDTPTYRPLMFLLTDGMPEGEEESVLARGVDAVKRAQQEGRVVFQAFGIGPNAAREFLNAISLGSPPRFINGTATSFLEAFDFVSKQVIRSASGQRPLPVPGGEG